MSEQIEKFQAEMKEQLAEANATESKPKRTCTLDDIEAAIVSEEYHTVGKKTTVCVLTLQNGFEVVGTSACVDASNYDQFVGEPFAREVALKKVWELEGYALQNKLQHG